jgi:hypothetical protein
MADTNPIIACSGCHKRFHLDGFRVSRLGERFKTCIECAERRKQKRKTCPHGQQPDKCIDCDGSNICEHKRVRHDCKPCGGSAFCEHNRKQYNCRDCGGKGTCEHSSNRSGCLYCLNDAMDAAPYVPPTKQRTA